MSVLKTYDFKKRNLAEIGLSVTDSERAALLLKSTLLSKLQTAAYKIYEYCNDFMNDLTPLFHSFWKINQIEK